MRPANMRPVFTSGWSDGFSKEKLRPDRNSPVYHGGVPVAIIGRRSTIKAVWRDDYGAFRSGHSGDVIQMLFDLGLPDRSR